MTKEQEELQEKHARFKTLQEARRGGKITEEEERELVALAADLEERSIDSLVAKALQGAQTTTDEEMAQRFIETARRAYREQATIDFETRATTTSTSVEPARPSIIQEIIQPLEAELIHTQLGLKIQTGVVGQPVWPILAAVEASLAGEDAALVDQALSFSKLTAKSERIGVTVPITYQALAATNVDLRSVTIQRLGQAVGAVLNKALFAKIAPSAPNNGVGSILAAPYATPITSGWSTTVAPTLKEIVALEAEVLGKDVKVDQSTAYFVHPKTYCLLKSTPVEKGNPQMLLVDGRLNGYPVVSTTWMPEDAILFGVLSYAVLCQHGDGDRFYAQYNAKQDRIESTLNGDYSITVLRNEAFAAIKRK